MEKLNSSQIKYFEIFKIHEYFWAAPLNYHHYNIVYFLGLSIFRQIQQLNSRLLSSLTECICYCQISHTISPYFVTHLVVLKFRNFLGFCHHKEPKVRCWHIDCISFKFWTSPSCLFFIILSSTFPSTPIRRIQIQFCLWAVLSRNSGHFHFG